MLTQVDALESEVDELPARPTGPALSEADLRALADILYQLLKEELRIERERLGR